MVERESEQKHVESSHLVAEYNRRGYQAQSPVKELPTLQSNHDHNDQNVPHKTLENSPPLSLVTLDTQEQIRQVLSQGHKITVEYVDKRRFSMGSWQTCGNLHISDYQQAVSALESCLLEHAGEYVRLVVIDPKLKRRVLETIIQRPLTR